MATLPDCLCHAASTKQSSIHPHILRPPTAPCAILPPPALPSLTPGTTPLAASVHFHHCSLFPATLPSPCPAQCHAVLATAAPVGQKALTELLARC